MKTIAQEYMSDSRNIHNDKLCILPWVHLATYTDGSGLLCCIAKSDQKVNLNSMDIEQARNSDYFKQARLDMLNNKEYTPCMACYKEEKAGLRSHRQHENLFWKKTLGEEKVTEIINNTKEDGTIENDLYTVDFRLGNTCNLQCVMCRPQDSSKWYKEATILSQTLKSHARYEWDIKKNVDRDKFEWYKDEKFLESFYEASGEMRQMIFAGGEPLLIKEHKDIIKRLVENGTAANIKVNYHTNGTIYDPELMELWKHFKRVDLFFSFDGIERINKYVRFPSMFDTVVENFKKYNDNGPENMHFKVLYTVQALNIYYIPEFVDWLLSLKLPRIANYYDKVHNWDEIIHTGILHYPRYLSPKIFPDRIKRMVTRKLTNYKSENEGKIKLDSLDGLCELMNSESNTELLNQFNDYIENIDKLRNLDSKSTFHELDRMGLFKPSVAEP